MCSRYFCCVYKYFIQILYIYIYIYIYVIIARINVALYPLGECAEEYVEGVVCKQEDIKENEMKMVPLGEECKKILLIKQKGELHAIGTKCSHYGGILQNGALGDGYVRCPWHGACFNIKTGDIEDWGYDSLPCYQVFIHSSRE